jgi:ubiquinol-cytochrome c reductase iron-sulfur subunit
VRPLRAIGRALLALWLVLRGRRRPPPPEPPEPGALPDPSEREPVAGARAELLVVWLLVVAAGAAIAFVALYALHPNTQLLGLSLGLALGCLGAAAAFASKRLVPQEVAVEERPQLVHGEEVGEVDELVREGGEGISRRGLLIGAAGAAGATVGAALVVPAASLGPRVDGHLHGSPWRRGTRLVDEHGRPLAADDIAIGSFATALPEGHDPRNLGAPAIVVRLRPDELDLPARRADWAPEGFVAYSKICTHAACAVAMERYPVYQPTSQAPALVCPCHYSTFDPRRAAKVIFGPAGRPLPQLPLEINAARELVAGDGFSGDVGPAWWGVRRG